MRPGDLAQLAFLIGRGLVLRADTKVEDGAFHWKAPGFDAQETPDFIAFRLANFGGVFRTVSRCALHNGDRDLQTWRPNGR
jgi:hypothetical protein